MWHYGVVRNSDGSFSILDANACKVGSPFRTLEGAWSECGRLNSAKATPWWKDEARWRDR